MSTTPTPTAQTVLAAAIAEYRQTGVAPTIARLCALCPDLSRSTIVYHVRGLAADGYVSPSKYHGSPVQPVFTAGGMRVVWSVEYVGVA